MSPVSDPDAGGPLVESLSDSPGGWSAPDDVDLATEVAAPAALLAEVVELAAERAVFPSRPRVLAELAIEHASVRRTGRLRDRVMSLPRPQSQDRCSAGPRPSVEYRGLDTALMTTAAAARYLGLAGRDSARTWLAQRGIRPVGREPGPSGQNLYPIQAVLPLKGRGRRRRPVYDRWRDAAGVSIPLDARVEQVLVDRAHGALASRLGKQTQVICRSRGSRLVVRFDGETQSVSIRPDLVRVRPVSTGQILAQLQQLRALLFAGGDGDGR